MCVGRAASCRQVIVVGRDPKAVAATYVITISVRGKRKTELRQALRYARDAVERSTEVGVWSGCAGATSNEVRNELRAPSDPHRRKEIK